jgi:hypothetical protein
MEHYEVQDTMNRAKTPVIDARITSRVARTKDLHRYTERITLHNKGAIAAKNMKLVLAIPRLLRAAQHAFTQGDPIRRATADAREYPLDLFSRSISDQVLFPQDVIDLADFGIFFTFEIDDARFQEVQSFDPSIEWTIYADDMAPRRGSVRVASLIDY